ncbi:MAG: ComEC family competence protein [Rhizobiales bacterium]|nr:ComEC family competence protein [Hyphomicrobiales bacterium]
MSEIWHTADLAGTRTETGTPAERLLAALNGQQTRLFLWVPVCLIVGVAGYFSLPVEPPMAVFVLAGILAAAAFYACRRSRWTICYLAIGLVATGFFAGKIRTEQVRSPQLAASTGSVQLAGWVTDVAMSGPDRARIVVEVATISKIRRQAWPRAVQLTVYKLDGTPRIGEYLQARVRLFPLITPVAPGAFDYGRTLWFRGIGATGRGVLASDNERTSPLPDRPSWRTVVAGWRSEIGRRIHAALPRDIAAFAEALITGNRAQIKPQLREQLSIAGLAHVLAISGLHMSLVAGGMFWLARAVLAVFSGMTLRWPTKKFAAVAALATGAAYLLLSGGAISTQRAYIMLSVMFMAVLFDRPAISLRNLAIAATLIVLLTPEAVLSAGFQMSFLAVMGLIATYEALWEVRQNRAVRAYPTTQVGRSARWLARFVIATATTTLIASVFTGLPAAYHFNRIAPLGVIANVLALPIVSLIVMPMAGLATLLMPLGLDAAPLWVMGKGLAQVTAIAEWVTGLPHASIAVPTLPFASALSIGFAAVWLCLWQGRLRLFGAVPAAIAVLLSLTLNRPDILIERAGKNVAVRGEHGLLVPATARRAKFVTGKWLLNDGDDAELKQAASRLAWTCSKVKCKAVSKGCKIVFLREGAPVHHPCEKADILISDFPLRGACANVPVRIDRFDLWRHGAHAIHLKGNDTHIVTAAQMRGKRPWVIEPIARRKIQLVPTAYKKTAARSNRSNSGAAIRPAGPAH